MKTTKNLTDGNISKNLLIFAIPLILSSMLSQAYSTVDAIIAGKFISEHALGAISATSSYDILFTALITGFAGGFAIYTAQLFGKGDFSNIKRDVIGMSVFVALLAVSFSALSLIFREQIMDFLNIDPILREDAEIYFTVYTLGFVIFYANQLFVAVLHSLGITSFSLYVTLMSAVLNIAGNLVAVLVLDMGVAGLALSTILASLAASVVYIVMLHRAYRDMPGECGSLVPSFACVKSSLRYTVPYAIQNLSFHGVTFIIAPTINALGAAATTGYSIANRLYALGTISLWAYTSAFGCYTGQCVGRKDTAKIRLGVKVGFGMNCAIVLPFVLTIVFLAKEIVSLFFPDTHSGEAFAYAVRYATVFFPFIYLHLIGHFLHTYMRSLGRASVVLWITLIGSVTRIAATLLLVPVLSLDGAFIGQILSWGIDAVICITIYAACYRTDRQLALVIAK